VRRDQIVGLASGSQGVVAAAALLVAGCFAAPPAPSATARTAVALTISSAPGDRLAFEPAETTVRATGPIMLTFQNGSSLPHNMTFTAGVEAGTRTIVRPGTTDQILLAPPPPGAYPFVCTIHDGMAGRLIVEPASAVE
jgi:plastocyanin